MKLFSFKFVIDVTISSDSVVIELYFLFKTLADLFSYADYGLKSQQSL